MQVLLTSPFAGQLLVTLSGTVHERDEVVEAAYNRMSSTLGFGRDNDSDELALHYRSKLETEEGVDTRDPQ
jgi:hypothetical protein